MTIDQQINQILAWYDVGDIIDAIGFDVSYNETFYQAHQLGFIEQVNMSEYKVLRKPVSCSC